MRGVPSDCRDERERMARTELEIDLCEMVLLQMSACVSSVFFFFFAFYALDRLYG